LATIDITSVAPSTPVARHRVRKALEQMILEGAFPPRSKLIQQDLAAQFDVSLSVIREALLELQATGLVETVDNRGAFVSPVTREKLIESLEVRGSLEGLAARLCCDRATRADVRALTETAQRIYELATAGRLDEAGSLDREFHQRLMQLSRNGMLMRLSDNYRALGKVLRFDRNPAEVRGDHLAILEAIADGRADDAERHARAHIEQARLALEQQTAGGTFVPHWVH
jgi:DNA-binding GntR family transcriptional regulator